MSNSLTISVTPAQPTFVCHLGEMQDPSCVGLTLYKEHEGKQFCILHYPGSEKVEEFQSAISKKLSSGDFNFKGVWFPDTISFESLEFNDIANFSVATFCETVSFAHATFQKKASFGGVTFLQKVNFESTVMRETADFLDARFFSATNFRLAQFGGEAIFNGAKFDGETGFRGSVFEEEANFGDCTFNEKVVFMYATFKRLATFVDGVFNAPALFMSATFVEQGSFASTVFNSSVNFEGATFHKWANFISATFNTVVDFELTTFGAHVSFTGEYGRQPFNNQTHPEFKYARVEKPELVDFHTLQLRPHWFINVDPRRFNFVNIEWPILLSRNGLQEEIEASNGRHRLLAIATRQLAVNAEENHRYEEASRFRYWSMDVRRLEHWHGHAFWTLLWWYWLASGYGERVWRAFAVLLGLWLVFSLAYTRVGFSQPNTVLTKEFQQPFKNDSTGRPLTVARAATYSLEVMSLQKPEPKPLTTLAHLVVIFQTILGPFQAALLEIFLTASFVCGSFARSVGKSLS